RLGLIAGIATLVACGNSLPQRLAAIALDLGLGNSSSHTDERQTLALLLQVDAIGRQNLPALVLGGRVVGPPQPGSHALVLGAEFEQAGDEPLLPADRGFLRLFFLGLHRFHSLTPPESDICCYS